MSGGSWDYAYIRLIEVSEHLRAGTCPSHQKLTLTPAQRASRERLANLVDTLKDALREIEMVDSSDGSTPADLEATDIVFAGVGEPKIELRHDDKGDLDEVVCREASLHMEDMGSSWALLIDAGGAHLNLSIGGKLKRPLVVEQRGSVISTHPKR